MIWDFIFLSFMKTRPSLLNKWLIVRPPLDAEGNLEKKIKINISCKILQMNKIKEKSILGSSDFK